MSDIKGQIGPTEPQIFMKWKFIFGDRELPNFSKIVKQT